VRIVGGEFKGRVLKAPRGRHTRPTSDRVREALFNILGERVVEARVADCFAGTGAIGLEALSRGARAVDFFESARDARRILQGNVERLGVSERVRLVGSPLPRGLVNQGPWDLVFMDPPWTRGLAGPLVDTLNAQGALAADAWVIVEERVGYEGTSEAWSARQMTMIDHRVYGDTALVFLTRVVDSALA
jgi:16S rRNA (guanine966-N2)-methyltransferase